MALKLKLCGKTADNCSSLILTDITEEYNSETNLTGWEAPNISTSVILEAYITIISSNPTDRGIRYDLSVSDFPTTVTGAFPLLTITDYKFNDGEYTITYTINTTDEETYETSTKVFITCGVACCLHKLWLAYITEGSDSGCSCNNTNDPLKDALMVEGLYRALLMSAACLDTKTRDKLLSKLQAICGYINCNCS